MQKTLTLRGLSLFLPFPTLASLLHIFWPLFTFSTPNMAPFPTWSTTSTIGTPKRFVGLIQIQCSPSFDCNWGKQNDPTACWPQLQQRFQVLPQEKCLSYPPDCVDGVTETPNCVGKEGTVPPSNPH